MPKVCDVCIGGVVHGGILLTLYLVSLLAALERRNAYLSGINMIEMHVRPSTLGIMSTGHNMSAI